MTSKRFTALAICLILLVFSISALAQTAKDDAIDIEYQNCLLKDTSAANIDACAFVAFGKWNKEMDKAYDKLMKELKKDKDKAALKQSQIAWKAYRDAEFTSYDNMFNCPGNSFCVLRQNGRIEMVRARALQLKAYLESLKSCMPKKSMPKKQRQ